LINLKSLRIVDEKQKMLVDISLSIKTSTALIGESGSGKSLTIKSLLNLLPENLTCELDISSDFALNSDTIGFVPQNPFTSLSPLTRIKNQFFCSEERQKELFKLVGLDSTLLDRFPSEISGGQLQRAIIAMSLSNNPKLLLLDEPTTALDTTSKEIIIDLVKQISTKFDIKVLFVTHDISSIVEICDDIVIIKNGQVIENGNTLKILHSPTHSYTKELIESNFKYRQKRA